MGSVPSSRTFTKKIWKLRSITFRTLLTQSISSARHNLCMETYAGRTLCLYPDPRRGSLTFEWCDQVDIARYPTNVNRAAFLPRACQQVHAGELIPHKMDWIGLADILDSMGLPLAARYAAEARRDDLIRVLSDPNKHLESINWSSLTFVPPAMLDLTSLGGRLAAYDSRKIASSWGTYQAVVRFSRQPTAVWHLAGSPVSVRRGGGDRSAAAEDSNEGPATRNSTAGAHHRPPLRRRRETRNQESMMDAGRRSPSRRSPFRERFRCVLITSYDRNFSPSLCVSLGYTLPAASPPPHPIPPASPYAPANTRAYRLTLLLPFLYPLQCNTSKLTFLSCLCSLDVAHARVPRTHSRCPRPRDVRLTAAAAAAAAVL
jgi:hypothetical protein